MIGSFRHRGLKRLHQRNDASRLPSNMVTRIEKILSVIDTANSIEEINLPSFRLHRLSGDRKGLWAVTVRANWRITFRFDNGQADDINFVDYH
ncbi:MAG: type II toxin-antitoxin system RelE/ParE family toxin [Alphaproteobacteria bacterium]